MFHLLNFRPSSLTMVTPKPMRMATTVWTRVCKLALVICLISGCAINPVTGKRELTLVSDEQAIAIGEQQYAPAQQMQGGSYQHDDRLSAYISAIGKRVAAYSGVDLPYEFVVLNHSVPNAWALPGGKIAVNRGLLSELTSEAEVAAVLGHEVAHAAARHGAQRMERGLITQGLVIGAAIAASGSEYGGYVVQGAQVAAGLLGQKYSRDAEREADLYGTRFMAKAGYDPRRRGDVAGNLCAFVEADGSEKSGFCARLVCFASTIDGAG